MVSLSPQFAESREMKMVTPIPVRLRSDLECCVAGRQGGQERLPGERGNITLELQPRSSLGFLRVFIQPFSPHLEHCG